MNHLIDKINSFYDIKQNGRFLIYFKDSDETKLECNKELIMVVTNGENVWKYTVNEDFFKINIINQEEFYSLINSEQFELNNLPNENTVGDLEFKLLKKDIKIILKYSKTSKTELKNLIFRLFEKNLKLENENVKLIKQNGLIPNETNKSSSLILHKSSHESESTGLKKFSISKHSSNRKNTYSIIKKKKPNGIKFDEEENDD
ncbi:hypothetical protein BpHYR1_026558 [Brachionus plicatilis]|uniref:Uncharacterized protein n=1 Tax=Brachionus plicatilis TaxID=10195 RepID=A0A3M7R6A6_BRAPC|nr:hypothetical protein BpHYR1_026558 [Brachionus plicatilis]